VLLGDCWKNSIASESSSLYLLSIQLGHYMYLGLPVYCSLRVLDYRFGTPTTGSVGDANNKFVLVPDPPEHSTEGSHSCDALLDYDQFPLTDAA
jgi:hypothetical protein